MNSNINDKFRNTIVLKLYKITDNKLISRLIEKSIYNYTIQLAIDKNFKKSWENNIFKELYLSKVRSIYTNRS